MEGVVEAVVTFVARGQVIPTIGKTYLVAVEQVELQSEVGTHTRERHTFDFIAAENGVEQVDVGGVVVHEGIWRALDDAAEGQRQLAVEGQQVVRVVFDEGEVILYHGFGVEVDEHRRACGGIAKRRDDPEECVFLQTAASPEMQTVAFAVVEAIEKLPPILDVDVKTADGLQQKAAQGARLLLHMEAMPVDGDTQLSTYTKAPHRHGGDALVVGIGDAEAHAAVQPNRNRGLTLGLLFFVFLREGLRCQQHGYRKE